MISENQVKKYCRDDISLIENYDKAVSDTTQLWHCHHRRETIFSRKDLIEIGEYYNRPACELIFLTPFEHLSLHNLGKPSWMKGKHHSADTCKKIAVNNGCFWKGKHRSAETCKKIAEANKGKRRSAQTCKKIGEARKGMHWYNNGETSILAKTCPEGFVPGRLK